MNKKTLVGGIVMILAGILLGVGGFFLYRTNENKIAESEKVTAVIDEIETIHKRSSKGKTKTEHKVYVDFEYDDKEYEHYKLGYYSSSMHEGGDIDIYVYENSSGSIEVLTKEGTVVLLAVFGIFAVVLVGVGIGMTVITVKSGKNEAY
ncbi:MAG: hypothetical protein MJ108_02590 [Saccharofermentans sp.]|nr:hypothetical protein [Saccharofermentans sp.]